MKIAPLLDHYAIRARLQPALITALPLALGVMAWVGPKAPWISGLWTILVGAGITYFLAILVRNKGKEIEPKLWATWGGSPTTQLLRHSGPANPLRRARWHAALAKRLGRGLPSESEERADPKQADEVYEAATRALIANTRDTKKHPLLYGENVQYGFCRNLYAARNIGITLSAFSAAISLGAAIWFWFGGKAEPIPFVCFATNLVLLWCWLRRVRAEWVRIPAFAYAERLFEITEVATTTRKTATKESANAN